MSKIKIEKGIPLPEALGGINGASKYSFIKDMEIGDSFVIPVGKKSAYSMAHRLGRDYKVKFAVRAHSGAFRVWRIA